MPGNKLGGRGAPTPASAPSPMNIMCSPTASHGSCEISVYIQFTKANILEMQRKHLYHTFGGW